MKNKNELFILFGIIIALGLTICSFYFFPSSRTYQLNLPGPDSLHSISIKYQEKDTLITDKEEMEEILDILVGEERTTQEESIQDAPVNAKNLLRIDFNFMGMGTSTIFLYSKNNKYYIEQPYNGIYELTKDEYNSIEKFVK